MVKKTTHSPKTSQLLEQLAESLEYEPDFHFGQLVDLLNHRSYGVTILIFALPSILPFSAIPGVSTFFSLPIVFFSIQLIIGRKNFWLPRWLRSKKINIKAVENFLKCSIPSIRWVEKIITPRYLFFSTKIMQALVGILLVILSLLLMLPIPLSNMVFGSLIAFVALGLVENDGLILLLGFIATAVTITFYYHAITVLLAWIF